MYQYAQTQPFDGNSDTHLINLRFPKGQERKVLSRSLISFHRPSNFFGVETRDERHSNRSCNFRIESGKNGIEEILFFFRFNR